jgi:D-tyrosyl-tRNA(Tyr) deacylase
MRAVVQRVSQASVTIDKRITGAINKGLLILIGIGEEDTSEDVEWLSSKLVSLRIFEDAAGKMNMGIKELDGEILLISQFTLFASTQKGNRPSFTKAARPEQAVPLYDQMIRQLTEKLGKPIATGIFGADMKISLINDGPVTIIMDTKNKE